MTTQEAYERIRAYFSRPDAALAKVDREDAQDQDWLGQRCMYRTPDGRACAVGCLIPDEYYRPDYEGRAATWVVRDLRAVFYGVDVDFLRRAQRLHDSGATETVSEFIARLDELAAVFGLRVLEEVS